MNAIFLTLLMWCSYQIELSCQYHSVLHTACNGFHAELCYSCRMSNDRSTFSKCVAQPFGRYRNFVFLTFFIQSFKSFMRSLIQVSVKKVDSTNFPDFVHHMIKQMILLHTHVCFLQQFKNFFGRQIDFSNTFSKNIELLFRPKKNLKRLFAETCNNQNSFSGTKVISLHFHLFLLYVSYHPVVSLFCRTDSSTVPLEASFPRKTVTLVLAENVTYMKAKPAKIACFSHFFILMIMNIYNGCK